MEQIVKQTREGVRRSIVPEQELLNAERRVLEYKFKLAELTDPPAADPRLAKGDRAAGQLNALRRVQAQAPRPTRRFTGPRAARRSPRARTANCDHRNGCRPSWPGDGRLRGRQSSRGGRDRDRGVSGRPERPPNEAASQSELRTLEAAVAEARSKHFGQVCGSSLRNSLLFASRTCATPRSCSRHKRSRPKRCAKRNSRSARRSCGSRKGARSGRLVG